MRVMISMAVSNRGENPWNYLSIPIPLRYENVYVLVNMNLGQINETFCSDWNNHGLLFVTAL